MSAWWHHALFHINVCTVGSAQCSGCVVYVPSAMATSYALLFYDVFLFLFY